MKTHLTYGLAMAVAGAILMLLLYLFGLHSNAEQLSLAQGISIGGALAISITCIFLGQRSRRDATPPHEAFGYGKALGAGVLVVLFGALIGSLFNYVYFAFINPDFNELIVQAQLAKMEAQGRSSSQIAGAEKMIRMMTKPSVIAVGGIINNLIMGTILSLITAAFAKRSALQPLDPPPIGNA